MTKPKPSALRMRLAAFRYARKLATDDGDVPSSICVDDQRHSCLVGLVEGSIVDVATSLSPLNAPVYEDDRVFSGAFQLVTAWDIWAAAAEKATLVAKAGLGKESGIGLSATSNMQLMKSQESLSAELALLKRAGMKLLAAFATWRESVAGAKELAALLQAAAMWSEGSKVVIESEAFASWRKIAAAAKQEFELMRRVGSRMLWQELTLGFTTWRFVCKASSQQQTLMQGAVARLVNQMLAVSFSSWRGTAGEMLDELALLKRAGIKLMSSKLLAAFATWWESVAEATEQAPLLKRAKGNELKLSALRSSWLQTTALHYAHKFAPDDDDFHSGGCVDDQWHGCPLELADGVGRGADKNDVNLSLLSSDTAELRAAGGPPCVARRYEASRLSNDT